MSAGLGRPRLRTGTVPTERCGKAGNSYIGQVICHARWVGMLGNCPEPSKFKHTIAFSLRSGRESFDEGDVLESSGYIYHLTKKAVDSSMASQPVQGKLESTLSISKPCAKSKWGKCLLFF